MIDPLWSLLLPSLVAILGWTIVNSQNNKRETRKEGRSAADASKKLAMEVCTLAVKYYIGDRADPFALKSTIEVLEIELGRFPMFNTAPGRREGSRLMGCFIDFDHAITGGKFESTDQPVFVLSSPEVRAIVSSRNRLLLEVENQFRLHFC